MFPLPGLRRAVSVQGEYAPVNSTRETITGALPTGWEEDSAWADVDVNYRPQSNNPYSGERSLRVEVGNVLNGVVQFRVPNVEVAPSHIIRMRIPLRSEDNRGDSHPHPAQTRCPLHAEQLDDLPVFEVLQAPAQR